jgi:threonine 3-dehydrogenase
MTALLQSGLDITPVITHHFGYKDIIEGIELMKSGQSGKIVVDWAQAA